MINELLKNKWILGTALLLIIAISAVSFFMGVSSSGEEMNVDRQTAANEENQDIAAATENTEPGYFFVEENDGAVNVYWYEGEEKQLYRETGIEFSLLSAEDQKLLKTGIRLEDEQELANFLENFDS